MSKALSPAEIAKDLVGEGRAVIEAYHTFLQHPAYQHNVDLAVLSKLAADENVPVRERRRAAEMLLKFRLDALHAIGTLTAAREQAMDALGLKPNPQALALTQINQTIEIVRASDWRSAKPLQEGEAVDVLAAEVVDADAAPALDGHATNGHASTNEQEAGDAQDPPA